jgi:hypothetical protein
MGINLFLAPLDSSFRNESRFVVSSSSLLYIKIDIYKICSRNNNKEIEIWERETGQQGSAPSSSPHSSGKLTLHG